MNTDTRYTYSVARIRALERKLLDRARIEMMLEAKTAQEVLKILAETDYGSLLAEIKDVYQYEQVLGMERKRVFELLRKIAPQKEIIDIFAVRYDFHNLKVLLKAKYLGEQASELTVDAGTIDPARLEKMVAEDDWRDLPANYRQAVEAAVNGFNQSGDPQTFSFLLDAALFDILIDLAKRSGSEYLVNYFRLQIDLLNIGAFLRVKNLNKSREFLDNVLLANGTVEKRAFLLLYNELEPADALISRLSLTEYAPIVEEGARFWAKHRTTTHFEKLADNFLLDYVKSAKSVLFGVEPLLAYLIAKDIEIRVIRMIMISKLNGIPAEDIKERLRDVYA